MANQTDTMQLALWGISFRTRGWIRGGNRRLSPGPCDLLLRPAGGKLGLGTTVHQPAILQASPSHDRIWLIYLVTHSFLRTVTGLSFLGPGCGLCTGHSGPSSSSRRDPESQMASPTGLTPPTKLTSLRAPRGEKCLLNLGPGITLKAGDCRGLPGPLRSPQRVNSQRYADAVINYFQKNFFKCARINSQSLSVLFWDLHRQAVQTPPPRPAWPCGFF